MKLARGPTGYIGIAGAFVVLAVIAILLTASGHAATSKLREYFAVLAASGVSRIANEKTLSTDADSNWDKRWWIDKTARLLRDGEGLGPDDDVDELVRLSEEEIARQFMNDPRFGDSILDFNMYFLGFKVDEIKVDGNYIRNAFDFPSAIASAQAILKGDDYFKLFDLEGEYFMAPLRTEPLEDPPAIEDAGLAPELFRRKAIDELRVAFTPLIEIGSAAKTAADGDEFCRKVLETAIRNPELIKRTHRAFNDAEIFALIRGYALSSPLDAYALVAKQECDDKPDGQADVKRLTAALRESLAQINRAFAEVLKFEPAVYRPRSVLEFKPFDLEAFPEKRKWLAFGYEQGLALGNSSTNFNRKRSGYMLKRFFCDDLIPVGFEDPNEHVGGVHGSATTCYACHYKLDPMAGFFRSYGAYFYDYARKPFVIFDDLASKDRATYETAWRVPNGSKRQWDVGYIRSPRWVEQNNYGESLADLSRIIRDAPEAKRCLMKRLFEYAIGQDQTIDEGYLDHLTRQFETEAATNSSAAMKNAIVRIVRSATFRQRDADPRQCYDFASGAKPDNAPPCRVAFILQKNCSQCHNAADESNARLNLSEWVLGPDGKSRTFRHLNKDMKQLAPQETLVKIVERVSSSDPKVRMPQNRLMTSQERQELFLWASGELERISKGKSQ